MGNLGGDIGPTLHRYVSYNICIFKKPTVLTTFLSSLEKEALKRAAGGQHWASSEYGSQYKDLFNVARPIAGPKLGLREAFKPRAKKTAAAAAAAAAA